MASFTLNSSRVPPGSTVKAYAKTNWPTPGQPSGAPQGSSAAEGSMGSSGVTLASLTAGTPYWAVAEVGGSYVYVGFTAGADKAEASDQAHRSELEIINLGTDWSAGEMRSPYNADNPAPRKHFLNDGTAAAPVTSYAPTSAISRVHKVDEAGFSGAGEAGLAAIRVTCVAVEGSQGQAIGGTFAGVTLSSYEGAHSLADGIGSINIGVSRGTSTRTGQGIFALGRTEVELGRATGSEIVVDNETALSEEYTGVLPRLKAMHVHAFGTANSAAGIVINKPTTTAATLHTGIAITSANGVTDASYRDDGNALRSIRIRGTHTKAAMSINAGAGLLVIGAEEKNFAGSQLFEVYYGEEQLDPGFVFGTDKGKSVSGILMRNSTGQAKVFASNATNAFLTGTAQGDTGINFTAGKVFHVGAQGKTSLLRVNETGVGFNGAAPVAKASAIGSPAAELAALKTAVDAIRVALTNVGITA